MQLVAGRHFTEHDRDPNHGVAIIDDKLARLLWPGRSAIGQTLYTRVGSEKLTVVGVVKHVRLRSIVDDLLPQIFVPWQLAQRNPMAFVVTTSGDPVAMGPAARAAVSSLDRRLAIYDVRPMTDYVTAARSTRRFTMTLASAFAVTALLLTCVGVYGVLAYSVAQRRHEFGVRRALGADTGQVLRSVMREGLGFASLGCVLGVAGALAAARVLQTQLYAIHPRDPVSYTISAVLIVAAAAVACWIPAYRATTVSPMDALRTE